MSVEALSAVFQHSGSRQGARLVLISLANRADEHGISWPGVEDLEQAARLSRSAVKDALKRLREMGEIEPIEDAEGGRYRSTVYRIVLPDLDGLLTPETQGRREGWIRGRRKGPDSEKGSGSQRERVRTSKRKGPDSTLPYIEEPSKEPIEEPSNPPNPPEGDPIAEVWAVYVEVMKPRKADLDQEARVIIRAALKVASVEECRIAIRRCAASDFHMKRGKHKNRPGQRYNKLSQILKGRRGKETTRERIDFWLDLNVGGKGKDQWGWDRE